MTVHAQDKHIAAETRVYKVLHSARLSKHCQHDPWPRRPYDIYAWMTEMRANGGDLFDNRLVAFIAHEM